MDLLDLQDWTEPLVSRVLKVHQALQENQDWLERRGTLGNWGFEGYLE